jgi:hypothetical protein
MIRKVRTIEREGSARKLATRASVFGNAALVEALQEARHVAVFLQREGVLVHVAAEGEIRRRHAGLGEVAAGDDEPTVARVLEIGERAGLECLGRHEADLVAGVAREPGSRVRLRVGKVDEGGHAEVVVKQGDLAGAGLVEDGEGERGGDRKHAIRLDDGHVVRAEVADMEGEGGG